MEAKMKMEYSEYERAEIKGMIKSHLRCEGIDPNILKPGSLNRPDNPFVPYARFLMLQFGITVEELLMEGTPFGNNVINGEEDIIINMKTTTTLEEDEEKKRREEDVDVDTLVVLLKLWKAQFPDSNPNLDPYFGFGRSVFGKQHKNKNIDHVVDN